MKDETRITVASGAAGTSKTLPDSLQANPTKKIAKPSTTDHLAHRKVAAEANHSRVLARTTKTTAIKREAPSNDGIHMPVTKRSKTSDHNKREAESAVTTSKSTTNRTKIKSQSQSHEPASPGTQSKRAKFIQVPAIENIPSDEGTNDKADEIPRARHQLKKAAKPSSKAKRGTKINTAPRQVLDIFVFGEGGVGELGLGHRPVDGEAVTDVIYPRLNPFLTAGTVGVVSVACGGMHTLVLTKDNTILSWGINDHGALGRDTDASDKDSKDDEDEEEEEDDEMDLGLNKYECTPAQIDTKGIDPEAKFVQVAASDSASFALTEDGRVYSWGTFRNSDGILGFSKDILIQSYPVLLDQPRKIVSLATGSDHVLALDEKGKVHTWGAAEQCQLGRRVVQRDARASALRPGGLAFRRGVRIVRVAAGAYSSFAIDDQGRAWAWGLNNFGHLGIGGDEAEATMRADAENAAAGAAVVLQPGLVGGLWLDGRRISHIIGGLHHSLVVLEDGELYALGRADGNQLGLPSEHFNHENSIISGRGQPRALLRPARVDVPPVASGDSATDSNLVVTRHGRVYAWGFNVNYQCGVGETEEDVITPTLLDSPAIRDRTIVYAGCGGQFGVLASIHEENKAIRARAGVKRKK